jgi:hypothetical protein
LFSMILADFLAFTFLEWFAFAAVILLLIGSISTYSDERYAPSFVCLIAAAVGGAYITHTTILSYLATNGLVLGIAKPVIAYLVIGLVVSLFNWIMYNMRAKDRYADAVRNWYDTRVKSDAAKIVGNLVPVDGAIELGDTSALVKKAISLSIAVANQAEIFGRAYRPSRVTFSYDDLSGLTIAQADEVVTKKLHDLLPPKALRGVNILSSAVFEWPITILSLLFSRFLQMIVNRVLLAGRGLFDFVSRISFGSHDVKL